MTVPALPFILSNGTVADATQVMADFNALLNAINNGLITKVGTITDGIWQGTIIGLTYGGTGVNLSATGGVHQALMQENAGAALTVRQLTAADVSGLATSATTDTTDAGNISSGTLAAARGGAGTVIGALKGNGSGVVSQAAMADISDYTARTSWTPTDASGAGLTLAVTDAKYVRIGQVVILSASIGWPSNSSPAAAKIGGLPLTAASGTNPVGGGAIAIISGAVTSMAFLSIASGGTTITGLQGSSAGTWTNQGLSGSTIGFTIMYLSA